MIQKFRWWAARKLLGIPRDWTVTWSAPLSQPYTITTSSSHGAVSIVLNDGG